MFSMWATARARKSKVLEIVGWFLGCISRTLLVDGLSSENCCGMDLSRTRQDRTRVGSPARFEPGMPIWDIKPSLSTVSQLRGVGENATMRKYGPGPRNCGESVPAGERNDAGQVPSLQGLPPCG
jgi:hypothetical protein